MYYNYKTDAIYNGLVSTLEGIRASKKKVIINGGDTFVSKAIKDDNLRGDIFDGVNQESVYMAINFDNECFKKQKRRTGYILYQVPEKG